MRASESIILDEIAKPRVGHDGISMPAGFKTTGPLVLGDDDDVTAPRITYTTWPPNMLVEPHMHDRPYCEIIIKGSQRVGKAWYHAGHARMVSANVGYGPLQAGPAGCTFILISAGQMGLEWLPEGQHPNPVRIAPPLQPDSEAQPTSGEPAPGRARSAVQHLNEAGGDH